MITKHIASALKIYKLYSKCHFSSNKADVETLLKSATNKFEQLLLEDNQKSINEAADMLVCLEVEEKRNAERLLKIQLQIDEIRQARPDILELHERRKIILKNIEDQRRENIQIQVRAAKEVENAKKYSITKMAKEIVEMSDYIKKSIAIAEKMEKKLQKNNLKQIQDFSKSFALMLKRHGIEEFDPIGLDFDPNSQESMGSVPTDDQSRKNKVAETLRTGFRLNGRLLRSAYVNIYS